MSFIRDRSIALHSYMQMMLKNALWLMWLGNITSNEGTRGFYREFIKIRLRLEVFDVLVQGFCYFFVI